MSATIVKRQEIMTFDTNRAKRDSVAPFPTFGSRPSSSSASANTAGCIGAPWNQNIWSTGGLAGSVNRGTQSAISPAFSTKTGSGLLAESSVPDALDNTPPAVQPRTDTSNFTTLDALGSVQPRKTAALSAPDFASTPSGFNNNASTHAVRAPVHLGSTARSGFDNALASSAFWAADEPPNVYTKFDRPSISQGSRQSVQDFSAALPQTILPSSRLHGMPATRYSSNAPVFTAPDYSFPARRDLSQVNRPRLGRHSTAQIDNLVPHFSQLNVENSFQGPVDGSFGLLSDTSFGAAGRSPSYRSQWMDERAGAPRQAKSNIASRSFNQYPAQDMYQFETSSQALEPMYDTRVAQPSFYGADVRRDSAHGRDAASLGCPLSVNYTGSERDLTQNELAYAMQKDPQLMQVVFNSLANQHGGFDKALFNMAFLNGRTPVYVPTQSTQFQDHSPRLVCHELAPGEGFRSVILDEFLKGRIHELHDIYNHVVEFSGVREGSRFIQRELESANSEVKERIFQELLPNALQLMKDVFGNYVIQKFFEHGDQRQKKILAGKMKDHVVELTNSAYGCRVVQKALEHILNDQQAALVAELEHHVLSCVKNQNGNHVIQKAIEQCPTPTIRFIIDAFKGQALLLSSHPYGCRVIQRCLEHCQPEDKETIMVELKHGMTSLVSEQYGNYVVQHVVEHGSDDDRKLVLNIVRQNLEGYSCNRFASNVVEKCVIYTTDYWRRRILESLLSAPRREHKTLIHTLVNDNYGNYVIQRLLDHLNQDDYCLLCAHLQPEINSSRRSGSTKQAVAIEKKMHRFDHRLYNMQHQQHELCAPSRSISTGPTPPPLVHDSRSVQTSYPPSYNGDAIEGAADSRKGSDSSCERGILP